jgi:hypothetical protein
MTLHGSTELSATAQIIANTLCKSGRFETGEGTCSLICMSVLGDARKAPCPYRHVAHGPLASQIEAALAKATP